MAQDIQQYFIASPYFAGFGSSREEAVRKSQFEVRFKLLSPLIQQVLSSPESAAKIYEIGENYALEDEETELVASVVRKCVLGDSPMQSLPDEIATELSVPREMGLDMARELIRDVLAPAIHDILQGQKTAPQTSAPRPPAPPTPPQNSAQNNIIDLRNRKQ